MHRNDANLNDFERKSNENALVAKIHDFCADSMKMPIEMYENVINCVGIDIVLV